MIALIDEYRYELLKVSGFAQDTVETMYPAWSCFMSGSGKNIRYHLLTLREVTSASGWWS